MTLDAAFVAVILVNLARKWNGHMTTIYAIKQFGGVKKLADALGIWPQAVYSWGDTVPPLRAFQIEELLKKARAE